MSVTPLKDAERGGGQARGPLLRINFSWARDHVIRPFERDLDHVILRVVGNSVQR